jgi:Flp pilus assembly protein TadG
MNRRAPSVLCRLRRDRSGAVAVLIGVLILVLAGFSAIVVDLGYLLYAQRSLQASTDSAALAGAQDINAGSGGTAITTAIAYSAVSGGRNANPNLTVTMATGYPQLKCLTSTGVSCSGPDSANAIVVVEQATVPLYFARVLGINSWQISATATASARGSVPVPLDVMIILDTTASMNDPDGTCPPGTHKIDCALLGVQTLLGGNGSPYGLLPCSAANCGTVTNGNVANPVDEVGVMVFPGLTNASQAQYDYDCSSSQTPAIAAYNASPVYQVIPLSSDYRISASAATLSASSDLAKAAAAPGCTPGIQAIGGFGTYYADAITAAQAALVANGRPTVQNVIILLSDGDASASSGNMPSAKKNNQCHEAITAAALAAAAGTWVYSIAYGSSTSPTPGSCSTDAPAISACSTLQQIASDATKFYSDASGGCVSTVHPLFTALQTIFEDIVLSTTRARLLPNNTT